MQNATAKAEPAQRHLAHFGSIPVVKDWIYFVNDDIPANFLIGEALCIAEAMAETADRGVEEPITSAQAWMLESNARRLMAILTALDGRGA